MDPQRTVEKTTLILANTTIATETTGRLPNSGIAFAVTAHIASTTGEVTSRYSDHTKIETDWHTLAIAGHYKARTNRRKEDSMVIRTRKSI
jgi:hypothetical protein